METVINCTLSHPSRICLVGNAGLGKTSLACSILKNRNKIFDAKIQKIYVLCIYFEKQFAELKTSIENEVSDTTPSIKFLNNFEELDSAVDGVDPCIIFIDDMSLEFETRSGSAYITEWFVRKSSHLNPTIIISLHHPFLKSLRTCSLNSMYNVYFNTPYDRQMISYIGRRLFISMPKYFLEAYM